MSRNTLETILIRPGLVDAAAVDDAEDYDGCLTLGRIISVAEELQDATKERDAWRACAERMVLCLGHWTGAAYWEQRDKVLSEFHRLSILTIPAPSSTVAAAVGS